jgi:hypothetical protein
MTTRLLRASLGSPTYDGMRDTLRTALHHTLLEARGLVVTGRALPLLRSAPDGTGRLEQVIRLTVTAPAGASVELSVTIDGLRFDQTHVELDGGSATADLFVPEVTAPTTARVVVADASGELGDTELVVTPQRHWTVHLVHHSHLDIGYTDRQGTVLRNHSEYLDSALDLAAATDGWPDDARFRWTVESALPLRRWLAGRAEPTRARFVELARAGRIEVTAMPFQLHTEACSTEELHRLLRFTDDLRTEYGVPVTSAMHTDVPGAVVGFVDALASSGVRYLSAAHNWAGRSVPFLVGGQALGRPFWWRAPSGARVLVWFTDTPHGMAYMEGNVVGLAEGYGSTIDLLPNYLDGLANRAVPYGGEAFGWSGLPDDEVHKPPYPHDLLHLRVQGGPADNAGPSIVPASVVRRWNETWAWPKLRSAVNTDFFTEAERRFGDLLPEHTGDWTDWWADGLGSGARPLGYTRRAQNALRQAETLHTLAGADKPSGAGGAAATTSATARIDAVYDRLGLFDEHTWGAANPWGDSEDGFDSGGLQWARKCEVAYQATDDAFDLLADGARRLGATLAPAADAVASFAVLNTGGEDGRTDVVEFFLPASVLALDEPFTVHDGRTGQALAHHAATHEPETEPTRPYGRDVWVLVDGVPSVGYVRLDVRRGGARPRAEAIARTGGNPVLENEFYRVEFDLEDAVLRSVYDKVARRELVNGDSPAGFGQYVYDKYSTAPHVNHLSGHIEAKPGDTSLLASRTLGRHASVLRAERTAVGASLTVRLDGDGVDWLRTTITVYHGVPRVEIVNTLMKQGAPAKESVFFAFPFALNAPRAVWELTGGVGGDTAPVVPGAAAHLRPIRHWVAFDERGAVPSEAARPEGALPDAALPEGAPSDYAVAWATLEAPLLMFGDLYLPYAPFPRTVNPDTPEPATIYSWALNNIWDTNFPAQQQGETTFRYALSTASGVSPRVLGPRTAAALTDRLVAVPLTGDAPDAEGAAPAGVFVSRDQDQVLVTGLAASRRGHRIAVWLRSVADHDVTARVRLPWTPHYAAAGDSLEREPAPVPVDGDTVAVPVPAGSLVVLVVD